MFNKIKSIFSKSKKDDNQIFSEDFSNLEEVNETEFEELNDILGDSPKIEENIQGLSLSEIEKEELKKLEIEEKETEKIEKESKKESKKLFLEEKLKNLKFINIGTLALISNIVLIGSLFYAYSMYDDSILPKMKKIEVYKMDEKKIDKDLEIVNSNLKLLEEEKPQALKYRKLNYLLEQSVPIENKYEDNIQIIQNILKDSISKYDKKEKYLTKLSLKPDTKMNDMNVINAGDGQQLLGISYSISVGGFEKYQHIKDFVKIITERLKIFHIKSLSINKNIDQISGQIEYKLNIEMYSYYRVPKTSDTSGKENVESDNKESTF